MGTHLNNSINRKKAGMIINGLCHEQQAFMVGTQFKMIKIGIRHVGECGGDKEKGAGG
jgi:hypothetical protein